MNCPYCSGRLATIQNNLSTKKFDLIDEWHPLKNKRLTPEKVTPFSHKKVWWKCSKGHEWQTTIANRVKAKGCPYCTGHKKLDINQMKEIAKSRGGLCLSKTYINARSKLLWECAEGHQWEAVPDSLKRGSWCPICGAKKAWAKRKPGTMVD